MTDAGCIGRKGCFEARAASRWLVCLAGVSGALAQNSELTIPPFGNNPSYGPDPAFPPLFAPDLSIQGQTEPERDPGVLYDVSLTRDLPYVPALSRPRREYNVKLGDATMLFSAGLTATYSDNALQGVSGAENGDFTFTPSLNMALDVPINEDHSFRLDLGVGYRYSLNYSELSSIYIAPRSVIDYRIRLGPVLVTFYDQLSTTADSLQRVDLRNRGTSSGVNFNRLSNQAGFSVAYNLTRETSVVGGYSFGLERGLDDSYSYYDSNSHAFNAALYHRLHPRMTVGLGSSYNINEFLETRSSLSSSQGWSVGPLISYRPSEFLNFSASVRYSSITYDRIGGIAAASDPATITFDVSAAHQINRYLSHRLTAGRFFNKSLSSAQMETYSADYGLNWRVLRNLAVSGHVGWQDFKQAGNSLTRLFPSREAAIVALTGLPQSDGTLTTAADAAAIYDFYSFQDSGNHIQFGLGTSYQFSRKLTGSLSYSHTIRSSDGLAAQQGDFASEFSANTVSINLSYRF